MKRILGLFIFNLFFTLSAYPQEVGDSVSNSSGPTKLRLFWKNVGFGKELFGKDNVGAIFRQAPVRSVNGRLGAVTLNKTDVGLSNVNNTADINKPISASTQAALDAKEPLITPGGPAQYFTGSKTWANLDKAAIGLSNVVNLDQSNAANLLSGTIPTARFGATTIPLTAIAQGGATSGQVISWNGTNWAAATMSGGGGGSGEANTASNVGVGGIGLYKQKTGVALEFRNINSSGKLTVTLDAANNEVDLDIVDANLSIAGTQLTGTIPAARFGSLSVPPSAISQGGASTNQVLQWNGSAWAGSSLGTAAFLNVASSGNAATGEVVKGNDTRLTDSRTPTTHVHAAGDITTGTFSSALFGNGTIATTKLAQTGATTGQAILWDGTAWNPGTVSTGSGGEANTASNVNTGGIGVFNGKVGIDLQFKGVAAASTKVSVSNNTTNKTVDVDVVDSNLSIAGSQLTGTIPAARFGATTIPISSFNVTGTASSSTYLRGDGTWTALSGTGEVNTGSNVNTAGVGVYNGKVGADLQFKGVAAGSSKVTITNNTTNKTVDVDIADANLSIAGTQLTGTIPAARMPAYTGDVTTSAGTVANTITNNAVTNAKAAQMAANTIKGNNTGATANAVDMTVSQTKTLLAIDQVPNVDATNASNLSSGSIPSGRFGATTVPISSINATGTASSSTYLRGDGTWNTLSGVGETNTASNVGVGGVGIYKQKTGVNFDLRNINAGSNKIGVTLDAANNEVDIDVNQANLSIATTQLTGTLQAAQFPAQTGDVTNTAGSLANTIGTNVVTNAKAAQMAANTVKMNATGSTANAQDVSAASFRTWLYSNLSIPISAINVTGTASSSTYLRGDGSWSAVPSAPVMDAASIGVTYGSVSAGVRATNLSSLNSALGAGTPIIITGRVEITGGTLSTTNVDMYLVGVGRESAIVQYSDNTVINFTCNTGNNHCVIKDLTINAAGDFTSGGAIRISSVSHEPVCLIDGVEINRTGAPNQFIFGIYVTNPQEATIQNVKMFFNLATYTAKGIQFDNNTAAVSSLIQNVKVYDAGYGVYSVCSTSPGIEGVRIDNCDFVGCDYGVYAISTVSPLSYLPPEFDIVNCHMNTRNYDIYLKNYSQIKITGNLLYNYGTSSTNTAFVFVNLTGETSITNNRFLYQGTGQAHGIWLTNNGYHTQVSGNHFTLASGTKYGVMVGANFNRSLVTNNVTWQGAACVYDSSGATVPANNLSYADGTSGALTSNDRTWSFAYSPLSLHTDVTNRLEGDVLQTLPDGKMDARPQYQTVNLTTTGTATYYLLATSSTAYNNGGNIDAIRVLAQVGAWSGTVPKQDIDFSCTTRDALDYSWSSRGTQQASTGSGIVVYRGSDDLTRVYLVLQGTFTRGTVTVLYRNGFSLMPRRLSDVATTTTPTGTLQFDSRLPNTYPYSPNLGGQKQNNTGIFAFNTTEATTYYKLGDLRANNDATSLDNVRFVGEIGGLSANTRQDFDIALSNRNGFSYRYTMRGTQQASNESGIVAYQNGDNTVSLYAVSSSTTSNRIIQLRLQYYYQFTGWPEVLAGSGTTTAPTGTVVFDTRLPGTYPASNAGSGGYTGVSTANNQTGTTYTLVSTDCGKTIIFNNASAITCTVPASVLTANCYVQWKQKGAGQVRFTAGAGLTLNLWQTYSKSGGTNAMGTIYYDSTTEATLGGQMSN